MTFDARSLFSFSTFKNWLLSFHKSRALLASRSLIRSDIMLARSAVRAASTSTSGASSSSALSAYLLLSRPPTILRSPTPFESAYHAYNSKLQNALSQPFPREIYFKKGSAAEKKFLEEEKERKNALLKKSNDNGESSTSPNLASEEKMVELAAEKGNDNQGLYRTISRRTKADEQGSTDSLERSLDRHLFLLVKGGDMGKEWTLPFARVDKNGSGTLHKAAPEAVHNLLGDELDIWMVTNLPIGVISNNNSDKGYVMRGHILSGQPDASASSSKGIQFAWLTREEIQERMNGQQWEEIEDLLCA